MTIIDLFCGCGGFGLGAELAGFKSHVAIDVDQTLQSSYKVNFPHSNVLNADLGKTNTAFWKKHLPKSKIDGVIGGPPCQGYSRMGHSDKSDIRRSLLRHFFRNVNIIKPKFFIMENVEGLMDKRNRFELDKAIKIIDSRYTILEPFIIDASEYGAPTKRKRVILIGYDSRHVEDFQMSLFQQKTIKPVTVKEAISDIPTPIQQSKDKNYGWASYKQIEGLSQYAKSMKTKPPKHIGSPLAKEQLGKGLVSGCFDTRHTPAVKKRYETTVPGKIEPISRSKRLDWAGLCPTLRAGTGSDKGSHQAVRPLHPEEGRVITVREAARLQGFPDWFLFHPTKWHSFRMIGNSVSPIVSKFLLSKIKTKVRKELVV